MSVQEQTRQQLDPIGTFGNNLATLVLVATAFVIAVVMTFSGLDLVDQPAIAIVALLVLGVSCSLVIYASSPYRAPFSRRAHNLVVALCVLAIAIQAASEWEHGYLNRDEWGPVALGLLFLAIGPYRPARELVATGSLAAVFVGFITLLRSTANDGGLPVLASVAVTVMPILALCYASAAYSFGVVSALRQWQTRSDRPGRVVTRADEDGIVRSVQQDRVTILNREVLPFFLEVAEKSQITDADRQRAAEIADSVRQVMVAEVDRSWLAHALDRFTINKPETQEESVFKVLHDKDHVANLMTYDQRTALRAFIVALHEVPDRDYEFMTMELYRDVSECKGVVVVKLEMADFMLRARFAPYFAVLRVMFSDLRLEYFHGILTLSFSYER